MSRKYNHKIKNSSLLSEKAKKEAQSIIDELNNLHKNTNKEELKLKKEYIDFRLKELTSKLKFS